MDKAMLITIEWLANYIKGHPCDYGISCPFCVIKSKQACKPWIEFNSCWYYTALEKYFQTKETTDERNNPSM